MKSNLLTAVLTVILGTASWYSTEACRFNSDPTCPTASGVSLYGLEGSESLFGAMWDVPLGQRVRVRNTANGKEVVVTILDRGPAKHLGRVIDLGKTAFSRIDSLEKGLITVEVDDGL